ncbi:hypothetical protein XarbCFBP7408_15520 [Xanthomonas arboricola pv. guizotiae]|uniref:Uncharacterized protein n=1 Tax=Xanthomonas arboricola pv. guizotiae TaxID=487867 RepID=A0A2S7A0S4_9XANT|nr:hypothetical protein XarbCFBP7409_11550 [Xanthomonas arboricola pv. guizotiae]PPU21710.1 hypothetical protein XarbCFBP7408_15520 [Xanthomonas arboricola pv. guizotiae]
MYFDATEASPRTLSPTPAPRPGPRLRRGRSKARAPVARKPCLLAPQGEELFNTLVSLTRWRNISWLLFADH